MSTDRPPLDDLDLSAFLDQEADDDVAARLDADPAAQQRLEQLRFVRDAVADQGVTALPSDRVDAIVAAALATRDDGSEVPTAAYVPEEPVPTSDARAVAEVEPVPITRARRRGVPNWAVAAVVVVLVGLGLTLVWSGRDARDDDSDMAFSEIGSSISAEESEDQTAALSEEGGDADAAGAAEMVPDASASEPGPDGDGAVTTTAPAGGASAPPTLVNLGEFPDGDALRVVLRDGFPAGVAGPLPDTGIEDDLTAAFRCLGKVDGLFEPAGEPTDVGLAMVAGEPTVVYDLPYRTDDGRDTTIVIAVNEVSCIPVVAFQR